MKKTVAYRKVRAPEAQRANWIGAMRAIAVLELACIRWPPKLGRSSAGVDGTTLNLVISSIILFKVTGRGEENPG
jgi:hypothetical protein